MCHGRDVHGWVRKLEESPSTCRWSVEVYVSQGPHQGPTVVFGYIEGSILVSKTCDVCERYSDSDWGKHLRTTGSGPVMTCTSTRVLHVQMCSEFTALGHVQ